MSKFGLNYSLFFGAFFQDLSFIEQSAENEDCNEAHAERDGHRLVFENSDSGENLDKVEKDQSKGFNQEGHQLSVVSRFNVFKVLNLHKPVKEKDHSNRYAKIVASAGDDACEPCILVLDGVGCHRIQ